MDPILIIVVVVSVAIAGAMIVRGQKVKADRAEANRKAERAAAEAWALDYHNPASPAYDPARVAAEEAEYSK